jgi:ATP-dependent RNA helicase DeaD
MDEFPTFEGMGLDRAVITALEDMGFTEPMEVQTVCYPLIMNQRDITVQARTGSGKTAAFAIPFAQGLVSGEESALQTLILEPTRELALQVAAECERICSHTGARAIPVYGGAAIGPQMDQLRKGAQIVAGTPGRVLDHIRRKTMRTRTVRILVLDEADEMLSMGFLEDILAIIKSLPRERQTLLFSATISDDIKRLASRYMHEPEHISLSADFAGVHEISHTCYQVSGVTRVRDLVKVLELEKPEAAIIFCNTRKDTTMVARYLKKAGISAEAISSDLNQRQREKVMERMRSGKLQYLVATDIAARGIDIDDLSHVINYAFPTSPDVYIHRTGRTGRAGKTGKAVSLVGPEDVSHFHQLKLMHKVKDAREDGALKLHRLPD